ncbi:MAG: hypothetical protein ACRDQ0_22135 [Pseudonocardia sp.]
MSEPHTLLVILAQMPDVTAALLREHTPDAAGLCRACGMPGTGAPYLPAPCPLARIAQAARQLVRPLR